MLISGMFSLFSSPQDSAPATTPMLSAPAATGLPLKLSSITKVAVTSEPVTAAARLFARVLPSASLPVAPTEEPVDTNTRLSVALLDPVAY